jgi:hypothetical protein
MHTSLIIVSMALGFGAGMLCWKCTEPWRMAARPGPTEGNARFRKVEMIAGFCSIGAFFVGGFAAQYLLLAIGWPWLETSLRWPAARGRQLVTLEDAGKYITKLPKAEHEATECGE